VIPPADNLLNLLPHRPQADPQRLKRPDGNPLTLLDQAQQDVLRADVAVVEHPGLFLRQNHNYSRPVCEPLQHLRSALLAAAAGQCGH